MRKTIAALTVVLASGLAAAQDTQTGSPINAQPPQLTVTTTTTVTPAFEPVRLWMGVGTEVVLIPGVSVALSVPVGHAGRANLALRASWDGYMIPFPDIGGTFSEWNADLLFSVPGQVPTLYGGPSVAFVQGTAPIWGVGGVAGLRNDFGSSHLGWFTEAKARLTFSSNPSVQTTVIPGVKLGLTYRF